MSRPRSRYDTLERMLNRTTLTLQRVTHRDIIEHGQKAFVQTTSEECYDKEKAVQVALEKAEARFARELRSMMDRLRAQKEAERVAALRSQKSYYDKHMAHVAEQRDMLEAERLRELRRQFAMEREAALRSQEVALRKEATEALAEVQRTERARAEAQLREEQEREVAEAIRKTEEACERRKKVVVEAVKLRCEEEAAKRLQEQEKAHEAVVEAEAARYQRLLREVQRVMRHNREIEADFLLMQAEYKRFLDNTDGRFSSDYMLKLRRHGLELANQELPPLELDGLTNEQLEVLAEDE